MVDIQMACTFDDESEHHCQAIQIIFLENGDREIHKCHNGKLLRTRSHNCTCGHGWIK